MLILKIERETYIEAVEEAAKSAQQKGMPQDVLQNLHRFARSVKNAECGAFQVSGTGCPMWQLGHVTKKCTIEGEHYYHFPEWVGEFAMHYDSCIAELYGWNREDLGEMLDEHSDGIKIKVLDEEVVLVDPNDEDDDDEQEEELAPAAEVV